MPRVWKTIFFVQAAAEESLMQYEKAADLAHSQAHARTKSLQKSSQQMEEQYKNILMQVVKSGSWTDPATGNPWVPEKKFLEPVQGVIEQMEGQLEEQKNLNTGIMSSHTQAVLACNSVRDNALTGPIAALKTDMISARGKHSSCRTAEDTTITSMEGECTKFDNIDKCDHDYDWYAALHENDDSGGEAGLPFTVEQARSCRQGIARTSTKAKQCDRDQDDFTKDWCDYQAGLKAVCDAHDTCYEKATGNWDLAESTILQLETEQKTIFRMLGRIRCYLQLLFGASDKSQPPSQAEIDTCSGTSVTDTSLTVEYGGKAERGKCYGAEAVKSEDTRTTSPGEEQWYNQEFGTMTTHGKLQPSTECGA